jgi:protein TonB
VSHTARVTASDPWARVFALGDRSVKIGAALGIVLAIGSHGVASARALLALYDLQKSVFAMRASIHEFLWTEYDVDLKQDKEQEPEKKDEPPPPPPEPEPDPVPVPAPKIADKPKDDPYEAEKAAPVQAAKILTAAPDPNKIEDLTDQGIVSGDATSGPLGGQSSAQGKSDQITHNPAVSLTGKNGGSGTADKPPPPPPPKQDLSRPADVVGSKSWSCPFPDEADQDQIDFAQVIVIVTVRADGSAQSVQVQGDPGHGFGRAARMCALARKYSPGVDSDGNPVTKSTPPIRVTFSR